MDVYIGDFYLPNCIVDVKVMRKIDRRLEQNVDGDDLVDLGRHSYEFMIRGKMDLQKFLELQKELEKGQPMFKSNYGTYKVAVKTIEYKESGDIYLLLVEDIR